MPDGDTTKTEFVNKFKRLVHLLSQNANSSTTMTGFDKDFDLLRRFDEELRKDAACFYSSSLPNNRNKNRYQDVLPNEMTLCRVSGVPECDSYFNGNYVCPPGNFHTYIACQAPLPNTCGDFWNVLWYYGAKVIVMLCDMTENGRTKSEKYWPNSIGDTVVHSHFEVNLTNEEVRPGYMVRRMCVTNVLNKETRFVTHFQYTSWPDFGVPDESEQLVEMMASSEKSNDDKLDGESRPIMIHCSAGIGRTGTFVAVQTALAHFIASQEFDMFSIVKSLKQQRCGMVQRPEQYKFAFTALLKELERSVSRQYTLNAPAPEQVASIGPVPPPDALPSPYPKPQPGRQQKVPAGMRM